MFGNIVNSISDDNLILLSYSARLLTTFTSREDLFNIAVECFADFADSEWVGILTLSPDGKRLCFESVFSGKRPIPAKGEIALESSPLADVVLSKRIADCPLASGTPLPLPATSTEEQAARCLCLPMVSSDRRPIGVVTIAVTEKRHLDFETILYLRMLTTVLTISLENAALFAQVLKDGLTGVYVRKYGETRLTEELARIRRYPGSVALVFLDIDYFKEINDTLGHQIGDQVLREFAHSTQACIRKDIDLVCRYGGDEFLVMVLNATLDEAREVAEKIRCECLRRFSRAPFANVCITMTGGMAVADHQRPLSAEELIGRADCMLYRGKQAGRNRIEVWTDDEASDQGQTASAGPRTRHPLSKDSCKGNDPCPTSWGYPLFDGESFQLNRRRRRGSAAGIGNDGERLEHLFAVLPHRLLGLFILLLPLRFEVAGIAASWRRRPARAPAWRCRGS